MLEAFGLLGIQSFQAATFTVFGAVDIQRFRAARYLNFSVRSIFKLKGLLDI